MEVEDLIEAEPAPVKEELRGQTVRDDAVAVLGHRLGVLQSGQLRSRFLLKITENLNQDLPGYLPQSRGGKL